MPFLYLSGSLSNLVLKLRTVGNPLFQKRPSADQKKH